MKRSTYFAQFKTNGFNPEPAASFNDEFDRLSVHMNWKAGAKAKQRTKALEKYSGVAVPPKSKTPTAISKKETSAYFTDFNTSGFQNDAEASFADRFSRLSLHMNWKGKVKAKQHAQALQAEMNAHYGSSAKLAGWQQLCEDVGIKPVPASITQCKKELAKVFVNITDLVQARQTGTLPPRRFSSLRALKSYSFAEDKVFDRHEAKKEGFIRALLRPLAR